VAPPVLLTISREAALPRLPCMLDIQDAYVGKDLEYSTLEDLGADKNKVGLSGSGIWVTELTEVPRKKKCELIEGDIRHQVQILMKKLRENNLME
jgi:electron transfer flavoprotein alpha/beta subunit